MPHAVELPVTFHLYPIRQTLLRSKSWLSVKFTSQLENGQITPDFDSKICGQIAPNHKNYPYYNTQTIAVSAFQALTSPVMYRRIKVK
jgi:hypothetical protein